MMKKHLIRLLHWLETVLVRWSCVVGNWSDELDPPMPMPRDPVMDTARAIVAQLAQSQNSSEWKRDQAWKALVKKYPDQRRRCGMAIELAVSERP